MGRGGPFQVTVRGSAKCPDERRSTDEQFQFHTRNPALVSSVSSRLSSRGWKGGKRTRWEGKSRTPTHPLTHPSHSKSAHKTSDRKVLMHYCFTYLISSHAVLLAERLAVFEPAQGGPGVAPRGAAELDSVGGRHRVQPLLHLCR